MELRANVTDSNIYKIYAKVLNSKFELSERALDIFASLLKIQISWPKVITSINVTDSRSRKQIMSETLVNKNNLSKYLRILREHKILVYNTNKDGWIINNNLIPIIVNNTINVTFTLIKQTRNE